MRSSTFYLILISLLSIFMWTCQQSQEETGTNYLRTAMSTHLLDTCNTVLIDSRGDTIAYQINENCAKLYINEHQTYIDEINATLKDHHFNGFPNSAEKLIYGAKVDLQELRRVLLWADVNSDTDSLYIMLGIMPTDSTELIFALKTTTVTNQDTWRYFDFTRPCPNACPKWE